MSINRDPLADPHEEPATPYNPHADEDPFSDLKVALGPCDECGGEGVIYVRRDKYGRPTHTRLCHCRQDRNRARRLRKITRQIPPAFRNMSFGRHELMGLSDRAKETLTKYHRTIPRRVQRGDGLWLSGSTGGGKTAAACMMVERAREFGIASEFWPVPEILIRLARVRHDEDYVGVDHEEQLHELLEEIPLLVLDDLSAAKTTPWALEQLYVIINRRYNVGNGRATIVTTDVSVEELAQRFSARTIRRLRDMTHEVNCDPPVRERVAAG